MFSGSIACDSFDSAIREALHLEGQVETVWVIGGYSSYKVSARSADITVQLCSIVRVVILFKTI